MDQHTIVLITGANAGLGFEMVKALYSSEKAYEIIVGGRTQDKAIEAADAVVKGFPSTRSSIWPVQVDIEDDESIQRTFDEVRTRCGRLDVLIYNAGMNHVEHRELLVF